MKYSNGFFPIKDFILLICCWWNDLPDAWKRQPLVCKWQKVVYKMATLLLFFQSFEGKFWYKLIIKFLRRLNEGHSRFLEKTMRKSKQLQFYMTIQSKRYMFKAKFSNMLRNKWKPLFEVNFSKNSTKAIRLFSLDLIRQALQNSSDITNVRIFVGVHLTLPCNSIV